MLIAYILLAFLCIHRIKLLSFNWDYCSREQTTSIKGIFVILVFLSHFSSYVTWTGNKLDEVFRILNSWIGQLMVVMFLFYSGFGIYRKIMENQGGYIKGFLKKRFLPVWGQFAICVGLFLVMDLVIGRLSSYSIGHIILSFTGWTSIGNSNWFMFDTFALYLLVFFSFIKSLPSKSNLILFSASSCALTAILFFTKQSYWWNTLLAFPLGMWFAQYKEEIDVFLQNPKNHLIVSIPVISLFLILFRIYLRFGLDIGYILLSLLFALSVALLTMKIKIRNKILYFFGSHVFSIYILQRIPMILLQDKIDNRYLYLCICFITTIIISVLFDRAFSVARSRIVGK